MQIRWSPDAAADLESIVYYIRKDNPAAAQQVGQAIYDRLNTLVIFRIAGGLAEQKERASCRCRRCPLSSSTEYW